MEKCKALTGSAMKGLMVVYLRHKTGLSSNWSRSNGRQVGVSGLRSTFGRRRIVFWRLRKRLRRRNTDAFHCRFTAVEVGQLSWGQFWRSTAQINSIRRHWISSLSTNECTGVFSISVRGPSLHFPLPFPFLLLEVGLLKSSQRVWGSAVTDSLFAWLIGTEPRNYIVSEKSSHLWTLCNFVKS